MEADIAHSSSSTQFIGAVVAVVAAAVAPGGGLLPYISHMGMCHPIG